ncbi:MAG: potassium channel protein [Candidatus Promineifilaceae bacterium]|nr:potassium channel protein [Candidatus Promineifilaceae bacterium]
MRTSFRRLVPVVLLVVGVVTLGTIGYVVVEDWSLVDAFYMTVITLSTVGFGEVRPLSEAGRLFTVALLFLGAGTFAYSLSTAAEYFVTANLAPRLRRRRSMAMISRLKGHVIVCGYGRVGRSSIRSLRESDIDVVVVERDEGLVQQVRDEGLLAVHGDATSDQILREAGIEQARGVIVCGPSDADNLFIVLSARTLNPKLHIVTRSVTPENEAKMQRAGADRVVSPYQIGGRHMANVLLRPRVTEFIDVVTLDGGLELWLEELRIAEGSPLAGKSVVEADLRRSTGVTLIALVRRESGKTILPDENALLAPGDELIVVGTREQLNSLEEWVSVPEE